MEVRREGAFVRGGNEKVAAEICQAREQRVGNIAAVGFHQKLVVREFGAFHIEVEHAAAVALAVNRLVPGLQVGAGDEFGESFGFGLQLLGGRRDEHVRDDAAAGLGSDANGVAADARTFQIPPVGDHGAGHFIGTIETRGEPIGAEGCRLADVQRLLAIGVVDGLGEVLGGEPQHHLGGRAAFLAGVEDKAGIGGGDKRGALKVMVVELPIHAGDAFGKIEPAAVVAERSGNLAADIQDRARDVMGAVGEVAEFAPSLAVDIVRGAKIAGLE